METWDYKPLLNEKQGEPLPDSVRLGQRLTGMSGNQASLPLAGSMYDFAQHGDAGTWASEFGRTNYSQGKLTVDNYGRDHPPRCFSTWMAGGGVKPGVTYGETCPYGYNVIEDGVHVRDFHATLLHLLGIDHERFTAKFQGLDASLTGVEPARVVNEILT